MGSLILLLCEIYGIEVENFYFDTMLASYVLIPTRNTEWMIFHIKYLKYKPIPLSDLIGPKKDSTKIFEVEINALRQICC